MRMGVNSARPDWWVSRQDTVCLRTAIRYSEVTKTSDVIEKYICYVIFEKNGGRFTPMGVLPHVTLSVYGEFLAWLPVLIYINSIWPSYAVYEI